MKAQWRLLLATVLMVACMTAAQHVPALLPLSALCGLAALVWVFFVFFKVLKQRQCLRLASLLLGIACLTVVYAQARAWHRLNEQINPEWVGQTVSVQGSIDSIPTRTPFGVRFLFKPSVQQRDARVQNAMDAGTFPERISTAWYDDDLPVTGAGGLQVGQMWSLPLGLKPPHAMQNPGVFDQEQYWFANGVRGLATVRVSQSTARADAPQFVRTETTFWSGLQNMRARALQRIDRVLVGEDEGATALLKALTFGDQSAISNAQWILFQQTGVTHLVSISGVHITMLAVLTAWLTQKLWRRSSRLCAWMPSLYAAQWLGLLVAFAYALLAGWALPAQRTVVMLAMWLWLSRLGVASSGVRVLCFALWGVLWFDPFAVLSISFWLSFGAVAWLILALGVDDFSHEPPKKAERPEHVGVYKWLNLIGAQLAIGLALLPLTLYFFHQASLLGVLVNCVAIPVVSGVVTPLILLACVLNAMFAWSWPILWAHAALLKGQAVLAWLVAVSPSAMWTHTLMWWQVALMAVIGIGLVWAVRQRRWWSLCGSSMLLWAVFAVPHVNEPMLEGQVRVHVLDVGQGSAILLQTAHHNWLYDAGPRYGEDSDAGVRVIVPYLREMGIERLDGMVLSHNDVDHTGGAHSVSQAVDVQRLVTSIPTAAVVAMGVKSASVDVCMVGQSWVVDGVALSMLSPDEATLRNAQLADNPKSCVLRVDAPTGALKSLLLTGDIDGLQEAKLVVAPTGGVRDWHSDVLLMPHHGSNGSSTAPFIEATSPKIAIAQAGYLNAFHHPHPLTLARYAAAHVQTFNTVQTGTLQLCIGCSDAGWVEWRKQGQRYWWDGVALQK